jgi:hypothetical protein
MLRPANLGRDAQVTRRQGCLRYVRMPARAKRYQIDAMLLIRRERGKVVGKSKGQSRRPGLPGLLFIIEFLPKIGRRIRW